MINFELKDRYGFSDLCRLVTFLRSENGCPWDHEQTHESIRRNLLEEAYEACEGIDLDDAKLMQEELGDVLLQVVFHADIEADRGRFRVDDVCDGVCKKLIYRHPHLFFGGERQDWDDVKKREKGAKAQSAVMDSVARSLPALIRSEKLQEKAAKAGFVCRSPEAALDALDECTALLRQDIAEGRDSSRSLGSLLFAAVAAARTADENADAETSLQNTCEQYIRRFAAMEKLAAEQGARVEELSPAQQDALWEKAGQKF